MYVCHSLSLVFHFVYGIFVPFTVIKEFYVCLHPVQFKLFVEILTHVSRPLTTSPDTPKQLNTLKCYFAAFIKEIFRHQLVSPSVKCVTIVPQSYMVS